MVDVIVVLVVDEFSHGMSPGIIVLKKVTLSLKLLRPSPITVDQVPIPVPMLLHLIVTIVNGMRNLRTNRVAVPTTTRTVVEEAATIGTTIHVTKSQIRISHRDNTETETRGTITVVPRTTIGDDTVRKMKSPSGLVPVRHHNWKRLICMGLMVRLVRKKKADVRRRIPKREAQKAVRVKIMKNLVEMMIV